MMIKGFPLEGVTFSEKGVVAKVEIPSYSAGNWQVNQHEFSVQADEVGSFLAREGKIVEYCPEPGVDPAWVRLYLNGQVVVALLHQRKIITFHASSFIYGGRGIMILGESGAGKSSVTASFTLRGASLLTDDVTPVIFSDALPLIKPLHDAIRIRKNTAEQLNIGTDRLSDAEAGTEKQYLQVDNAGVEAFPLHTVLKIEIGNVSNPEFHKPMPAEKFSLLRSEVCMWEILVGMPETEKAYLQQLIQIVEAVHFMRVVRPADIKITELHEVVRKCLSEEEG